MAGIKGIQKFRDFADDVEEINVTAAIKRAESESAKDFVDILTDEIEGSSTTKGGTFDSRTSPYEPGGTNDSSDDSLHITDSNAWKTVNFPDRTVVSPKKEVETRVKFLNEGTRDHGPRGDAPMHYFFNGFHVVVHSAPDPDTSSRKRDRYREAKAAADGPEEERAAEFRYGEPGEVSGVNAQNFLMRAGNEFRRNQIFENNLRQELGKEFEKVT